jgi:molybdenum cofactor cytidylyltransferase
MRVFGIIPAAGKSRRMGRPKLLLPCGGAAVLECVIDAVRAAGVEVVVVVAAPGAAELAERAEHGGALVAQLPEDTPDMRATCEFGLAWIEAQLQPKADDGWLLLPADHPTVRADVVTALLDAWRTHSEKSIFVPVFQGRRGHPTLLRWAHVAGVRALAADLGLNAYVRQQAAAVMEIEWRSDEVLRDLDTPADYERLLEEGGAHEKRENREALP